MYEGATSWKLKRANGQWHGTITFDGGGGGEANVSAVGATEREAIARAAVLAAQIAKSPVFAAVAPPGTVLAIKAIDVLARSKNVRAALRRFSGPGARRLAFTLARRLW